MNAAQTALASLSAWLDSSSASYPAPNGRDTVTVGRYANLVPVNFEAAPLPIFAPECLPLFVRGTQADGVNLAALQTSPPASQDHMWARLAHVLFRMEDGTLPRCAIAPLIDVGEPILAAVERAGLAGVDLATVAVLAVPLWPLDPANRAAIARRLPILP